MSPPVGSPPWREVGAGGEMVAGEALPEGCSVGTGIYSMHHNAKYFEDPHTFAPDRWLADAGGGGNNNHTRAFMPFSTGPRSCIGRSLAYAEISLTTAMLLWRYDFRANPDQCDNVGRGRSVWGMETVGRTNPEEFQLIDWILGLVDGPVLQFRPRGGSE